MFDDGSVGWYEAGWGPMMSEVAYFVKDVVGPKGCVSIVMPQEGTSRGERDEGLGFAPTSTSTPRPTRSSSTTPTSTPNNNFTRPDEWINMADEPDHQELCEREQAFFLKAIREDLDLTDEMDDAVNSLRIVLAAEREHRYRQGRGALRSRSLCVGR